MVEGRIATRAFTDREGNERAVTEIVVSGWQGMVNILSARRAADEAPDGGDPVPGEPDPGPRAGRAGSRSGIPGRRRRGIGSPRHEPALPSLWPRWCWLAQPVVGRGLGAVLHRAVREPDLGRLLGVPVPDLDRADHHRQRLGRAGHAEPVLADLPLRLADSRASASRSGYGSRQGWSTRRGRPGASPTSAASPSTPACRPGAGAPGAAGGDGAKGSVWHAHYYMYPLLSWIGVLLDLGCLEAGGLDIAWASELDPAWLDDELTFLLNPEAALFANLPAQAACAADCAAASAGLPLDPMFWCAGCQGGMYPLTGNVAAHVGGVQASLLASQRLLYRLHRAGLAWGTFGSGALCGRYPMPVMKKSQYRWQMTQPVPAVDPFTGCNPTGRSSVLWETLREAAGRGRELRLPAVAQAQLLPALNPLITQRLLSTAEDAPDAPFSDKP